MRVVIPAKTLAAALRRLAPLVSGRDISHFMDVAWFVRMFQPFCLTSP